MIFEGLCIYFFLKTEELDSATYAQNDKRGKVLQQKMAQDDGRGRQRRKEEEVKTEELDSATSRRMTRGGAE